jgi:hypothetical protein
MRSLPAAAVLSLILVSGATPNPDAPTGFDNQTNGTVDQVTHQAARDRKLEQARSRRQLRRQQQSASILAHSSNAATIGAIWRALASNRKLTSLEPVTSQPRKTSWVLLGKSFCENPPESATRVLVWNLRESPFAEGR